VQRHCQADAGSGALRLAANSPSKAQASFLRREQFASDVGSAIGMTSFAALLDISYV
jgi:hypothetical protein